MPLSPQDQADLLALKAARLRVASGTAVSEVEYAGERRAYARADIPTLDRLIAALEGGYGTVRVRL